MKGHSPCSNFHRGGGGGGGREGGGGGGGLVVSRMINHQYVLRILKILNMKGHSPCSNFHY